MNAEIPSEYLDLFNKKAIAVLSTLMPDGSPHASVLWVAYNGEFVLFNSITQRQKYKNIKHDPRVALVIIDPDNLYRYMEIRGRITEITTEKAEDFVDALSRKYLGIDYQNHRSGVTRVIYKLRPEKVYTYSG